MNHGGASGLRLGRQLLGRRPLRQGGRRPRHQHTAAAAAGGSGSSGSGAETAAGRSRFGWAKWALLPAAASALFGGKAAADAYSTMQTQLDVEAGHKRAERRWGAAQAPLRAHPFLAAGLCACPCMVKPC